MVLIDHDIIKARVLLYLQGGCTYNEALRRAYLQPQGYPVQHILHLDGRPVGS